MAYGGGNKNLDDYVKVHTRVEKFRADHPTARLTTVVIKDEPLTVRCEIYLDGNASLIPNSSGMADQEGGMGGRGNSALEKVETAAVGRALAFLGYEVKEGIASREEVQKAQRASGETSRLDGDIRAAQDILGRSDDDLNEAVMRKFTGTKPWAERPETQKEWLLNFLNKKVNEKAAEA